MKTSLNSASKTLALIGFAIAVSSVAYAQAPNAGAAPAPASFPSWAYPWDPDFKVPPADALPQRLPGSTAAISWAQARDLFFAPDWHPEDHPAMPDIVANGRKPDVRACGACHRAEGTGGPENASLAGLSADYIAQQIADYKSGARKPSGPTRTSITLMLAAAKAMTDDDIKSAAAYFSGLKHKPNVKVVESDSVPKTYIARLFFAKQKDGGTEPLGKRIIEVPDDVDQFELRDARAQFTAYVPIGSIAKGETLAKTGGAGGTVACATCHGPDLKGVGLIPGIAGRSPSYAVRQLYDFQQGTRAGDAGVLMKPIVEKLTVDDMIALAAYTAALDP